MGREKRMAGVAGEKIASSFLKKLGYRIIESNFRTPFGEIDIVAKHKGVIVFVEVKSRTTYSLGPPYLAVTRLKQRHLIKNAVFYLKARKMLDSNWRIDIVSVKLSRDLRVENIELIENAVENYRY